MGDEEVQAIQPKQAKSWAVPIRISSKEQTAFCALAARYIGVICLMEAV